MLNGMERTLEKQLPESHRRWPQPSISEDSDAYDSRFSAFPEP
jgi:hypothetical protein